MPEDRTTGSLIARVLWNRLKACVGKGACYCPPWIPGQYVTYVAGPHSEAPSYTYYRLILLQRSFRGWHLRCECKLGPSQIATFCLARAPNRRWRGAPPAVPQGADITFGEGQENDELLVVTQWAFVLNLLETMSHPDLHRLSDTPESIEDLAPLGSFTTHTICDGPSGASKVSRRVPITGILSASEEGEAATLKLTSFGCDNPTTSWQGACESYVDWSHPSEFDHGSFTLTYPGTWFFENQSDGLAEPERWSQLFVSASGGNTCAVNLSILLYRGEQDVVAARLREEQAAMTPGSEGFVPRQTEPGTSSDDVAGFDLCDEAVSGLCLIQTRIAGGGAGFALMHATLMAAHSQPGQTDIMARGERVLKQVFSSFRFAGEG